MICGVAYLDHEWYYVSLHNAYRLMLSRMHLLRQTILERGSDILRWWKGLRDSELDTSWTADVVLLMAERCSADDRTGSGGDQDSDQVPSAHRQEEGHGRTRGASRHQDSGWLPRLGRTQGGSTYEVSGDTVSIVAQRIVNACLHHHIIIFVYL